VYAGLLKAASEQIAVLLLFVKLKHTTTHMRKQITHPVQLADQDLRSKVYLSV
jgi:hypothetical protein